MANLNDKEKKYENWSLVVLVPKILKWIEEWKIKNLMIEKKIDVLLKLLDLLRTSIKLLLQSNIKTLSNTKFYENILKKSFVLVKQEYIKWNEKMIKSVWWKTKFNKILAELNQNFNLIDEKIAKNKTWFHTKSIDLITTNKKIRNKPTITLQIWKEIFEKWNWLINMEELQEIYESAIIPILNYLIKEDIIDYTKWKEFEKTIKDLVKHWIENSKTWKLLNSSKIAISYWPVQDITYNVKTSSSWYLLTKWEWTSFWSRWAIWYKIDEYLWNKKQTITWWSEYVSMLQQWLSSLKNKKQIKKVLLYHLIKQEFQNVHMNILNQLVWLIQDIQKKLKQQWIDIKKSERIIKIWNSIITFSNQICEHTELENNIPEIFKIIVKK